MDRIMSTSIIILDQNFNANSVDIMVFEPSVLSVLPSVLSYRSLGGGGGIEHMVQKKSEKNGGNFNYVWF